MELVMNLPIPAYDRVTGFLLELLGRFKIFNSVVSCKFLELICIGVTCIGTRAKKSLKFNVRTMVVYPIIAGFSLMITCIVVHNGFWGGIILPQRREKRKSKLQKRRPAGQFGRTSRSCF